MASTAVPFPDVQPPGYQWFEGEPVFDPTIHLQLEAPSHTISLVELGYDPDEVASKATPFAVSAPFRVLSDAGVKVMLETGRRLREFNRPAGERIERVTRGGCFRSKWFRDLCVSPELTAHMASVYEVEVAPHPMTLHLGHLNYEPSDLGVAVDKWHHDTIAMDFVMMVTDPATLEGGQFEWFRGTKHEAAELAAAGLRPPRDRVEAPVFPSAGYVIALHGDMVVHRAAALTAPGERITMVNGYVSTDTSADDQSRCEDLIAVDDLNVLWAEWAKFAAWRSAGKLNSLIDNVGFTTDMESVAGQLEEAISDAQKALQQMRAGDPPQHHYEK